MVHHIHQLHQLHPLHLTKSHPKKKESISFKEVLQQNESLKVSKHAEKRIAERNIKLNEQQLKTMHEKVNEAKQKGITESLVLYNDAAFVVNTKNNTIVTAMNTNETSSKIFTNIDGTILINE